MATRDDDDTGATTTCVVCVNVKALRKRGIPDLRTWLENDAHVYVGRSMRIGAAGGRTFTVPSSKWHNPFRVGTSRESAIERFRAHITARIEAEPATYDLAELRGKELGCWCKPRPCHGDVLRELVEARFGFGGDGDDSGDGGNDGGGGDDDAENSTCRDDRGRAPGSDYETTSHRPRNNRSLNQQEPSSMATDNAVATVATIIDNTPTPPTDDDTGSRAPPPPPPPPPAAAQEYPPPGTTFRVFTRNGHAGDQRIHFTMRLVDPDDHVHPYKCVYCPTHASDDTFCDDSCTDVLPEMSIRKLMQTVKDDHRTHTGASAIHFCEPAMHEKYPSFLAYKKDYFPRLPLLTPTQREELARVFGDDESDESELRPSYVTTSPDKKGQNSGDDENPPSRDHQSPLPLPSGPSGNATATTTSTSPSRETTEDDSPPSAPSPSAPSPMPRLPLEERPLSDIKALYLLLAGKTPEELKRSRLSKRRLVKSIRVAVRKRLRCGLPIPAAARDLSDAAAAAAAPGQTPVATTATPAAATDDAPPSAPQQQPPRTTMPTALVEGFRALLEAQTEMMRAHAAAMRSHADAMRSHQETVAALTAALGKHPPTSQL